MSICSSIWLQFRQTYIYQLLFLTSILYFQSAAVPGRRNSIPQPAQSPTVSGNFTDHPKQTRLIKIMKQVFEIEMLDNLENYLFEKDIDTFRESLFDIFLKYADYKNAADWNKAVRLCECLTIIGWGEHEPIEAINSIFFNGNPMTLFRNRYGSQRFVDAIWSKRKSGLTMEYERTSYFQSPDLPSKPTILWDYPVDIDIQDVKLEGQRNWIPKNPILITRFTSNCYENSKPLNESINNELQPALNLEMRPEKYGTAVNQIRFCCCLSYSDKGSKTNHIIANEKLKLKQKDFYPALLKMYSKKEIQENGYYLRNRYEYGNFITSSGTMTIGINFEKEFSELNFQDQKTKTIDHILVALNFIVEKLKKKKVEYNFDLMREDFLKISSAWK